MRIGFVDVPGCFHEPLLNVLADWREGETPRTFCIGEEHEAVYVTATEDEHEYLVVVMPTNAFSRSELWTWAKQWEDAAREKGRLERRRALGLADEVKPRSRRKMKAKG